MLKVILIAMLPFLTFFGYGTDQTSPAPAQTAVGDNTGTLEKLIVASGTVQLDIDLKRINGGNAKQSGSTALRFDVETDAFFPVLVLNNELRGPLPGVMGIAPKANAFLPNKLNASYRQLVVETTSWGGPYDLVVRDGKTGFIFFNIEGHEYSYDPTDRSLTVAGGRLLVSKDFAAELGRPSDEGAVVGQISIKTMMRAVEVTEIVDGEAAGGVMPALNSPSAGTTPGPDVIVGDLSGLAQFGSSAGTQVGLAVGTDSCNAGTVDLHWVASPGNDHPVIPQNLYRMSGGATNDERFEQIGQSSVKHAFTALTNNICGFGCNGVGGANLGSGCSDPYSSSLNSGPNLGSRAWINPFTGFYPRGDAAAPPNNHTGHTHLGPSHRILTEIADLNTSLNAGATYYTESQYVTPHEYAWCQANPTQCNMNNNVSYRRYNVTGTASPFSFSPVGATVRSKSAISAWTGASFADINPAPGVDGIGQVGYKVTNPSPGVWHYEYAVYNQNLDRAIQSFGIPILAGVTMSNVGFHAPPQQPGWTGDGTLNDQGFSNTPWAGALANGIFTWSSQTLAQNANANAIRWGTLYNFRFDSNRPPTTMAATVGFYKTGAPITVQVAVPSAAGPVSVSGRVTNASGFGVYRAMIAITDSNNVTRTTATSPFGFYSFDNVNAGASYTISGVSKRYTFTPRTILVNDNLTGVDFTVGQ